MNTPSFSLPSLKTSHIVIGVIVVLALMVAGTYNSLVTAHTGVDTAWSQVEADYQRRSDLVGQLVSTVRGSAQFEKSTLEMVINARSKATSIQVNANDPASLRAFESAQTEVRSSLSRLLVVAEQYPQLGSLQGFQDLQSQIEGGENRISVSRKDYSAVAGRYNAKVQRFPTNIVAKLFGFTTRPLFDAAPGTETAPVIDFGNFEQSSASPTTENPVQN